MDRQQIFTEMAPLIQREGGLPVYQQIALQIRQRIEQGELAPGQLLPTLQQMTVLLGVGEMTVRHALEELASQHMVVTRQGSGSRIADHQAPRNQAPRNQLTRKQASGGHGPIHIVYTDMNDGYPFLTPLVQSFKRCLAQRDGKVDAQAVSLVNLSMKEDDESRLASQIDLSQSRGVVFNSPMNWTLLSMCIKRGLPYVLLFNDLADGSSPCVMVDYGPGLSDALRSLGEAGRSRVVLFTPEAQRFSSGRLEEIFRTLLRAFGLIEDKKSVVAAGYHQQQGYEATRQLLLAKQKPDAILYCSDYQALGGLEAAAALGVRVPEEVAMVGMGDLLTETEGAKRLSTLDMHLDQLCQLALAALFDDRATQVKRHVVKSTFVPGQTS